MKSFIGSFTIAIFVMMAVSESNSAVTVCTTQCSTTSTANVCGVRNNRCTRFINACNFRITNCIRNQSFGTAALSRCRGIAVGATAACSATSTTGLLGGINGLNGLNGVSGVNGVNGVNGVGGVNGLNGLGLGSSSSSVTPIVIRV